MNRKTIVAVAKHELFSFILQPLVIVIFLLCFFITTVPFFFLKPFFINGVGSGDLTSFFSTFPYIFSFFIPIFTFRSYTNSYINFPVTKTAIILAKFLAVTVILLFFLITTLIVPLIVSKYVALEWMTVFISYGAIFLLGLYFIPISLFFSFLLKSSFSYLLTTIILLISNIIYFLPQNRIFSNNVEKLIQFFSPIWHIDAALKGIIDTRNIFFFLSMIAIFMLLTLHVMDIAKKTKTNSYNVKKIIHYKNFSRLLFVFFLLILLNGQRYYTRIDVTTAKLFSLSDISTTTLRELPDTVSLTYYVSPQLERITPQIRTITDFLRTYANNNNITFSKINPHAEQLEDTLNDLGVQSQQIESTSQNEKTLITVYSAIVIEYRGDILLIPYILSPAGLEYELTTKIQLLTNGVALGTYIVYGGNTPFDQSYPYVMPWLKAAGISSILVEANTLPQLSTLYPLLVIGSKNFSEKDVYEIESFIQRGGSAFFAVSRTNVDLQTWQISLSKTENYLLNLLEFWGFSIESSTVLDNENQNISFQTNNATSSLILRNYPFFPKIYAKRLNDKIAKKAIVNNLVLFWPNRLVLNNTHTPLFYSSEKSWIVAEKDVFTDPFIDQEPQNEFSSSLLGARAQTSLEPFYTARNTQTKNASRLVVIPNEYFISNMIQFADSPQNLDFLANMLLWTQSKDALLDLRIKIPQNTVINGVTARDARFTFMILMLIPTVIFSMYLIFMYKRRKIWIKK